MVVGDVYGGGADRYFDKYNGAIMRQLLEKVKGGGVNL